MGTALKYPRQGRTQLFRRCANLQEVEAIFNNPRVHTGQGYQRRANMPPSPPPNDEAEPLGEWEEVKNQLSWMKQQRRELSERLRELAAERRLLVDIYLQLLEERRQEGGRRRRRRRGGRRRHNSSTEGNQEEEKEEEQVRQIRMVVLSQQPAHGGRRGRRRRGRGNTPSDETY